MITIKINIFQFTRDKTGKKMYNVVTICFVEHFSNVTMQNYLMKANFMLILHL